MRDAFGMEPPNGDYVSYINRLLSGRERNLEPFEVQDSSAGGLTPSYENQREAKSKEKTLLESLSRASLPIPGQSGEGPAAPAGETPADRMRRRAKEANARNAAKAFGGLLSFVSLALVVIGIVVSSDWAVVMGIFLSIIGLRAAAGKGKK